MKLKFFKYMPAKYALATLRTGMIKVATTADVNDPNEIMPWLSSDGRDAPRDQCRYGATYKAIHSNCKNTRKRMPCPNCLSKGRTSATGKVTVACPGCDGQGTLVKTYYLVRDAGSIEYNREYI